MLQGLKRKTQVFLTHIISEAIISANERVNSRSDDSIASPSAVILKYPGSEIPLHLLKNSRILPNREAALKFMPKKAVIAEVGVAYGGFSQKIINNLKPKKLYLIDLFEIKPGDSEFWGMHLLQENNKSHWQYISDLFEKEILNSTVVLKKGFSWDVLHSFKNDFFDYVYLDAAHDYDSVVKDIEILKDKVKDGGFIQFNDYIHFSSSEGTEYGVVKAVDDFVISGNHEIRYLCLHPLGYADIVVKINKSIK